MREPLTALLPWFTTVSPNAPHTTTLFTAPSLSRLAKAGAPRAGRVVGVAGFQALPFEEPATGLVYARARWYDPGTATFLSPDPLGYRDSSNLYAFAGGDPINHRDPMGEAIDSEMATILDLVDKASREAAATHGLKTLADVEAGGDLGTAVHKTMAELLSPGGKYFHPRIAVEVEVDAMGSLIRSGPRGAAKADSLVKDIVILNQGQDIRKIRPGRLMQRVTQYVLDLKVGKAGARLRSSETLTRLGIRPLPFKPYEGVLGEFTFFLQDAVKAEQMLGRNSRAFRYLKGAGKIGGRILVVGGVLMVAVQYPARADEMGHPRAMLQSAYDVIPYSLITDGMVMAVENSYKNEPMEFCAQMELMGACADCFEPVPGCEKKSRVPAVEW